MIACPMCGGAVQTEGALETLVRRHGMTGKAEAVLRAMWASAGRTVTTLDLMDAIYADDLDGGPSQARMYQELRGAIEAVNFTLTGIVRIVPIGNRAGRWRLRIKP